MHCRRVYPFNPPTCGAAALTLSRSFLHHTHLQTARASDDWDASSSPRWSVSSCPSSFSSAALLTAAARSVASPSLIIACGALGAHANNSSATLLVLCADSQACTVFTNSPPCLCSIWLRSSSKQASSVVQLCVRRTGASCGLPQLPCK